MVVSMGYMEARWKLKFRLASIRLALINDLHRQEITLQRYCEVACDLSFVLSSTDPNHRGIHERKIMVMIYVVTCASP